MKKAAAPKIKVMKKAAAPQVKAISKAAAPKLKIAKKAVRAVAKETLTTGSRTLKKAAKAI
jgi:hypothetical protein